MGNENGKEYVSQITVREGNKPNIERTEDSRNDGVIAIKQVNVNPEKDNEGKERKGF